MKINALAEQQRFLHFDNMLLPLFDGIANNVWNQVLRRIASDEAMIHLENQIISRIQREFYFHEQEK